MTFFVDHRHEVAVRDVLGFASFFSGEERPLVAIIEQLGFVYLDGTLYVRVLCPGKVGKHPTNPAKRVRW